MSKATTEKLAHKTNYRLIVWVSYNLSLAAERKSFDKIFKSFVGTMEEEIAGNKELAVLLPWMFVDKNEWFSVYG